MTKYEVGLPAETTGVKGQSVFIEGTGYVAESGGGLLDVIIRHDGKVEDIVATFPPGGWTYIRRVE